MKRGAIFRHFCVSKVIATAHAHKSGVFFIHFLELSNKKIKELRPNMTKIASRGPAAALKRFFFLLQVVLFCDNSSDPSRRHNPEPRTNQNKFCSNRSVWEVLLDDHKDFVNFTAPSKSELGKSERDLVPNFKVRSFIQSYTCSRMVNSSSRWHPAQVKTATFLDSNCYSETDSCEWLPFAKVKTPTEKIWTSLQACLMREFNNRKKYGCINAVGWTTIKYLFPANVPMWKHDVFRISSRWHVQNDVTLRILLGESVNTSMFLCTATVGSC